MSNKTSNEVLTPREVVALKFLELQASGSWNVRFHLTEPLMAHSLTLADRFLTISRGMQPNIMMEENSALDISAIAKQNFEN